MKLLTPTARTLPSAARVSRARYASSVFSKADGESLVEQQQVDLIDAELRALFSKPCSVSSYP